MATNHKNRRFYPTAPTNNAKPEILSLPTTLAILTLPYKNPKKKDGSLEVLYKKHIVKNGINYQLIIQSGQDEKDGREYGIPYGMYARALLYYICSEVKKTKSLEINLGYTYRDILQKIKVTDGAFVGSKVGGKQIKDLKNQLDRLFNARIFFKKSNNSFAADTNKKGFVRVVENNSFLKNKSYKVKVTKEFFELILSQSITVFDYSLIGKLKGKLLSLDLAIFLNYWAYNCQKYKKDLCITYETLYNQFGSVSSQKEFNKNLKKSILEIQKHLPHLYVIKKEDDLYEKGIVLPSYSRPIIVSKEIYKYS